MRNLLVFILIIVQTINVQAQEEDKSLSPYFFVKSQSGNIESFPLKSTKVDVNIAGVIADVMVKQVYSNNGNENIEAVYIFPASTRAAVYGMEMKIGTRTIIAQIKEKNQARKEYNEAKAQGKRASLLEQERPNVFQMNVANILPGDEIEVTLKYTELLIPEGGQYEFIYPTVVGPRYTDMTTATASKEGDFTQTPYLSSGEAAPMTVEINTQINAGMPIAYVNCKSHNEVVVSHPDIHSALIEMPTSTQANKDYIVQYQLRGGQIQSGLMLYEGEEENFFTLMVQPPKYVPSNQIPPREYVFVLDVSGSMSGFPMTVSKQLMRNLICNLQPQDKFNVLLFAGAASLMAEASLPATGDHLKDAMAFIDAQNGGGGTQLLSALEKALNLPRAGEDYARSIVVVTDGYINVEGKTFDMIRNNLDNANVFAFGIGSSVNRYLIEGMANVGMGRPFIVESTETAQAEAERLRQYIQEPVLTRISVDFNGFDAYDIEPSMIPDVLSDRPVLVYGKYKGQAKGQIKVKGFMGGKKTYKTKFDVQEVKPTLENKALTYLWARERIKLLGDYKTVEGDYAVKTKITDLGLKYNLMTDYTSFVAIDHDEIASNATPQKVKQPLSMPSGVSNAAVGFELEIEGVTRHKKTTTKHISIKTILSNNEVDLVSIKKQLDRKIKTTYDCLKAEMELPKTLNLKIEIDKTGKIVTVALENDDLHEAIALCIENQLLGIILNSVVLIQNTSITITAELY